MDSLGELTSAHPEVWKNNTVKLLDVVSQIVLHSDFEPGTRSAAIEVVLSLSAEMPAALRKAPETSTTFFPALVKMLTEVEQDEETWKEAVESKDMLGSDVFSTGISAIQRFSKDIGEKKTLEATTSLVTKLIQSENWVERQAGLTLSGLIAESCNESFKKNLGDAF